MGEISTVKDAARPLKNLYGDTAASKFELLALKAIQSKLINDNLSRGVIAAESIASSESYLAARSIRSSMSPSAILCNRQTKQRVTTRHCPVIGL